MKVTVIGAGYVGLVTAACLAEIGHLVMCLDIDEKKIVQLEQGNVPIYEPGLSQLVLAQTATGRLLFTSSIEKAVEHGDIQIIAVGTPSKEDGSADLAHCLAAAQNIGRLMKSDRIIVNKSTVPIGASAVVESAVRKTLSARRSDLSVQVISNPEFLREGSALHDFRFPHRIVIGSDDARAAAVVAEMYKGLPKANPQIMITDPASSEMIKYASNAMLATRIVFMNQIAGIAELYGANIEDIKSGMGHDPRIGPSFLDAGVGYGGSCFPKDVRALVSLAQQKTEVSLFTAVDEANEFQKSLAVRRLRASFDSLEGKVVAVWGLAFKPGTDDVRESTSQVVIGELLRAGARVQAYDPVANGTFAKALGDCSVRYLESPLDAAESAEALLVLTEWPEFAQVDLEVLKSRMSRPLIFDGRNLLHPRSVRDAGFQYSSIGRP
jgi:UDPglucose 6-dehydrogenase